MSRIGKKPITVPSGVKVAIAGRDIRVEGPKGKLAWRLVDGIDAALEGGNVNFKRAADDPRARALHGLARSLVNNMVTGVSQGFNETLTVNGVEYRVEQKKRLLQLSLGYSHPIEFELPEGIDAKVDKTTITISGADKQLVGSVAAKIRGLRAVEPYKAKGIQYATERVRRKQGKTGAA